jgi:hypothetical protein
MARQPALLSAADFAGDETSGAQLCAGALRYFHYRCDGFEDGGWGCGYRTVQSMLSWLAPHAPPPSIPQMQALLGNTSDPRAWIGVTEAVALLDIVHGATVEVLPLSSGAHLPKHVARLAAHFERGGGPIMVGGGTDVYSKTVVGVRHAGDAAELLVLDPHYAGTAACDGSTSELRAAGWAAWRPLSILSPGSFYNLALPRPPAPCGATKPTRVLPAPAARGEADEWPIEVVQRGAAFGSADAAPGAAGMDGLRASDPEAADRWDIEVVERG